MAPSTTHEDYYSVLELTSRATPEEISKAFKRLALLKHPDKNDGEIWAKVAFQELVKAYDTLKDPELRAAYDRGRPPSYPKAYTTKTPETPPDTWQDSIAKELEQLNKKDTEIRASLAELSPKRAAKQKEQQEAEKPVTLLEAQLARSKKQDEEDDRISREGQSWSAFFRATLWGQRMEHTAPEQKKRELARLDRVAAARVKHQQLAEARRVLNGKKASLQSIENLIAKHQANLQSNARRRININAERESKRKFEEEQRRQADLAARREAYEAKRREAEAAFRRERDEAKRRQDEQEAEARWQRFREQQSKYEARTRTSTPCRHAAWWSRIEGRGVCSSCQRVQHRFVFRCPGCSIVACASCRDVLKTW